MDAKQIFASQMAQVPARHDTVRPEHLHGEMPAFEVPEAEPEFDGVQADGEAGQRLGAPTKVRTPTQLERDEHTEIGMSNA